MPNARNNTNDKNHEISRNVFLAYLLSGLFSILLIGAGAYAYRYIVVCPIQNYVQKMYLNTRTLGDLLGTDATVFSSFFSKEEISMAYEDPDRTLREMSSYTWAPLIATTPFVGSAPLPVDRGANLKINSLQMRSTRELSSPKQESVYRIFIVGGSTAFCSGSPSNDSTIGGFLEKMLNESPDLETKYESFEVFTMAFPGWASTHERIVIENLLSELSADLVLSITGFNDIAWGHVGQNVLWFHPQGDIFLKNMTDFSMRLGGLDKEHFASIENSTHSSISPQVVSQRFVKNVSLACYSLSPSSIQYVVFLQPSLYLTQKPLSSRESRIHLIKRKRVPFDYFSNCYNRILMDLNALECNNFSVRDLRNVFDSCSVNDEVFIDRCHFGDRGNRIIANRIFYEIMPIILEEE